MRILLTLAFAIFTCLVPTWALAADNNLIGTVGWHQATDGTINARFEQVPHGHGDNSSLKVTIVSKTGEATAGWSTNPVAVETEHTYKYSVYYLTNNYDGDVVVHIIFPDWHDDQYVEIGTLDYDDEAEESSWSFFEGTFEVPEGATSVEVINNQAHAKGWLRFDGATLTKVK